MKTVAGQLEELGHTITVADPHHGLRMSWSFLSRSTSGLLDWADRLGHDVTLDKRTVANMQMGRLLSENVLRKARAHEAVSRPDGSSISSTSCWRRRPHSRRRWRFRPPRRAVDDHAMIRRPVTWPWNLLGWPSINVPAGFTSDGLPIGVQLMGPANSEPLLISLAAELEAINGWVAKQPDIWWNTPVRESVCGLESSTMTVKAVACCARAAQSSACRPPTPTTAAQRERRRQRLRPFQAGCTTEIKINPKLRLAAQWHTNDVLNNRALDGDIGSDGSTVADRARNAGYGGAVAETVAINPALAISGVELINQWYYLTTTRSWRTAPTSTSVCGRRACSTARLWSRSTARVTARHRFSRPSVTSVRFLGGRPNPLVRPLIRTQAGRSCLGRAASSWRS